MVDLISDLIITHWDIIVLFFFIALLYASIGFGGGSSYLAVLALTGMAYTQIRSIALLCNIIVVTSNVFLYGKHQLYDWKKVMPLVVLSLPLAFIGGYLKITETLFFILLSGCLLLAAFAMVFSKRKEEAILPKKTSVLMNSGLGGVVGFISGMVGIGGGIFLAPILHLTHWDTPKKIAATASLFILVNSLAGLGGQVFNPQFSIEWEITLILLVTVFLGGLIGQQLSQKLMSPNRLKKSTAILIAFIGLKILLDRLL